MQKNVRPPFLPERAIQVAADVFGVEAVSADELVSELDRNYRLKTSVGEQYVLKFVNESFSQDVIDLQQAILLHLNGRFDFCPRVIAAQFADPFPIVPGDDGVDYRVRLVNYLPGTPLGDFRPHSDSLLADLGAKFGQLDKALLDFDHPQKRLDFRWNVTNMPKLVEQLAKDMPAERKAILDHFVVLYEAQVVPLLPELRHGFIHNDGNDYNLLVKAQDLEDLEISGIIDFGDVVYAPLVADVAVVLAYIMMNKSQPLRSAISVIRGYHGQLGLTKADLTVLFPLIAARLCMSVCMSWYQQQQEPDNAYLGISEQGAWNLLRQLQEIHPEFACAMFRDACGFEPYAQSTVIANWLAVQQMSPILGRELTAGDCVLLDLSIDSVEFGNLDEMDDVHYMTHQIFSRLSAGQVGIGHYNEPRAIYTSDLFKVSDHERRSVHVGVDLFAPAGTIIYAPLAGTVHSCVDNVGHQDYGPTIILRHETSAGLEFYTLYGHLSRKSLAKHQPGQMIEQGAKLAEIGDVDVNGGWPPHLHFQVINHLLGRTGEFPGVVSPYERSTWLSLCPNPNLILRLPVEVESPPGIEPDAIIQMRKENLNPALSTSYRRHLKIVRGYMHHLYDQNGQAYLDCVNNVPHIGHSNPRVVKAGQRQMAVLNTNTRYLHETIVEYAQNLVDKLPDPLSVCFLVCSGSEANELALRIARTYTGGTDFIVIDHAYHGNTQALIEISPYKFNSPGGKGKPEHVHIAEMPDGYRGRYRGYDVETARKYAKSVDAALAKIQQQRRPLAGFIAESILGCGGQVVLPDGYLQAAFESVRGAGGVCIADEVQIGFGRMGSHFWGFETQGVVPDIVTMGKPIGNGHPLAAVMTTPEIAAAFHNGMEYFNTFGGNPVSCAIGLEVLRTIDDEGLQQNAHEVGTYFIENLRGLMYKHPIIGQVRGIGLFLGIELVLDRETLEPAPKQTAYIAEQMKERGILITTEGPLHNVLKMKPPIVFKREHVDHFVANLDDILSESALQI